MKDVLWMCGCSTLWLLLMRPHHWPPVIGGTRTLRNARMLREFVRRSMPLLPPLVMSASGGLAHEASVFYQRLAHQLSNKWGDDYSVVMGWLRCCLSFSLLRSSIQCIRGARSSIGHYVKTSPIVELIRAESQFAVD